MQLKKNYVRLSPYLIEDLKLIFNIPDIYDPIRRDYVTDIDEVQRRYRLLCNALRDELLKTKTLKISNLVELKLRDSYKGPATRIKYKSLLEGVKNDEEQQAQEKKTLKQLLQSPPDDNLYLKIDLATMSHLELCEHIKAEAKNKYAFSRDYRPFLEHTRDQKEIPPVFIGNRRMKSENDDSRHSKRFKALMDLKIGDTIYLKDLVLEKSPIEAFVIYDIKSTVFSCYNFKHSPTLCTVRRADGFSVSKRYPDRIIWFDAPELNLIPNHKHPLYIAGILKDDK